MNYRQQINDLTAIRNNHIAEANKKDKELEELNKKLTHAREALLIVQTVAKQTQEQLEYRISELVTLALSSIFDNPYEFKVKYETKRNKTEASLWFFRGGEYMHPFDASGGGVVDIAAFALRVTILSISSKKLNNVIILDEPFKHLSADLQEKAGRMLKEISNKLNLQIIMVSHIEELVSEADKVFKVSKINGVSTVEEVI